MEVALIACQVSGTAAEHERHTYAVPSFPFALFSPERGVS